MPPSGTECHQISKGQLDTPHSGYGYRMGGQIFITVS